MFPVSPLKRIPNILTASRILLAPVFLLLFLSDQQYLRLLSVVVYSFAALTDYLDGYLARVLKADSELGNFIDPLADKILTFTGFFAFSWLNPDVFPWWILFVIMGRDALITLLRIYSNRNGKSLETSKTAKLKTAVQLIFIYLGLLAFVMISFPGLESFAQVWLFDSGLLFYSYLVVMIITIYTGIEYIMHNKAILFK